MSTFILSNYSRRLHDRPVTSANVSIVTSVVTEWVRMYRGEKLHLDLSDTSFSEIGIKSLADSLKTVEFKSIVVPIEWVFLVGFKAVVTDKVTVILSQGSKICFDITKTNLQPDSGLIDMTGEDEEEEEPEEDSVDSGEEAAPIPTTPQSNEAFRALSFTRSPVDYQDSDGKIYTVEEDLDDEYAFSQPPPGL